MTAPQEFQDRVAVVTGAARGIGLAIAERLAAGGARLALVDRDTAAEALAERLSAGGAPASFHQADLADADRCEQVTAEVVDRFGRVDVLVNNAATTGLRRPLLDLDRADWAAVLATNLLAVALLSRDAAREMAARGGGAIVNLASIQERLPLPEHVPYAASKGGLAALTRAMAVELAPHGIRVNAVAAGVIDTPGMGEEYSAGAPPPRPGGQATLLRRFGTPAEVAEAVAFLAGDRASFLTGAVVPVDGGRTLSRLPDPLVREPHRS